MTLPLLSSCFLHAKLISPSLHIWKSHEIPMASPSSHEITILHQISHHYLAGKTPWVSRVISFFFSTHRQAIGPPTFGWSWTRCHGVRWYNPEEKHWACNGTGRQDIISVFGVVHAARMFELTSLLCFFIWTWMVLVQPNPVSSFLDLCRRFSPPARWGLLDFITVVLLLRLLLILHLLLLLLPLLQLLLHHLCIHFHVHFRLANSSPTSACSGHCWTSTAVRLANPSPTSACSGHCWTSTAGVR